MPSPPRPLVTHAWPALFGALALQSVAGAQSVPGFNVDVFATPAFPNLIAFGADGVLYAGRDDDPVGSLTPRFVTRITADGASTEYGLQPILDPDALVVDDAGVVSGVANSVLVGGLIANPGAGRVTAIRPDQTVVTLFESLQYGNISELKFDQLDRLLFVSFSGNQVFRSAAGEAPTALCATGASPVYLTVAPDNRIFTSNQGGTVRINGADGSLINASFAQFSGRTSIEFAKGGGFGTDLLALETGTGTLYSVSATGVKTQIGTGITSAEDLAVGPCGAVYVSRRIAGEVLRISKPPSPDIDGNGVVDGADLGLLLGAWGSTECTADLNQDGIVDGADLGLLLGDWGPID